MAVMWPVGAVLGVAVGVLLRLFIAYFPSLSSWLGVLFLALGIVIAYPMFKHPDQKHMGRALQAAVYWGLTAGLLLPL